MSAVEEEWLWCVAVLPRELWPTCGMPSLELLAHDVAFSLWSRLLVFIVHGLWSRRFAVHIGVIHRVCI